MADKTLSEPGLNNAWAAYYEQTGQRPPRPTLIRALDAFDLEGLPISAMAADLGCGSGRDLIEMHRRGWAIQAVDASPDAVNAIQNRIELLTQSEIYLQLARYEEMELQPCDLVNASFSLPLCSQEDFIHVWQKVRGALKSGGRFSGQLYGDRDGWFGRKGMNFHTSREVSRLLEGLEVEFFEEEEEDSITPRGTSKHWHIFHIVAKKL
ncbi:MAG: hypothetical protein CFH41_02380 [Alphaproteobacteria bacterium MarineAlpha11_Bin1]|nr:MAG: hypothetical protein CFH41_02380 [Alphaproteobacteria bacterium MarineAlpha11_Bin1]|tara:strand:+ start:13942 stop:14568 length:627 start_codon:yes stop_codon:yes gene_type:complete